VNEKVGLTFASQLRAILRQDPDVVLVGEIRDGETAETAIRASLTGHLVLSTLHCNDAPNAIPRLLDMGMEPFLLSSSLIGVMAQRLIRRLCTECKVQTAPTHDELALMQHYLGTEQFPMIWRGKGCSKCHHTGYKGRMAIHEILPVVGDVTELVAQRASVEELRRKGESHGYRPMQMDALQRVIDGQTSLAEARRVVFFDDLAVALNSVQRAA